MRIAAIPLVGLLLIILLTGTSFTYPKKIFPLLRTQEIIAGKVKGELPGVPGSPTYSQNDSTGQQVIAKLTGWLNTAEQIENHPRFGKHGYAPNLILTTQQNKTLIVEPAYTCEIHAGAEGNTVITCSTTANEIMIYTGSEVVRAVSPMLFQWLIGGWKLETGGTVPSI